MLSIEENKYWIWLSSLKLRNKTVINLIKCYKNPKIIYNLDEYELRNNECIEYINETEIQEILSVKNRSNICKYIEHMIKDDIKVITINDKEYPIKLRDIYDYPIVLYLKGNINILNKKSIAIVGSRECTDYGRIIAKKLAYELSSKDIYIISGLAKGIDSYSHIGAIKEKAKTIAVLGSRIKQYLS